MTASTCANPSITETGAMKYFNSALVYEPRGTRLDHDRAELLPGFLIELRRKACVRKIDRGLAELTGCDGRAA